MSDPTSLTVAAASRALHDGSLDARALTEAYLARIAELNPVLNAYVEVTGERARKDAARAAELLARGDAPPLAGVPVGLKDLYDTAGIPTTGGSAVLAGRVPERDSTVAARLAEQGAVLLGKLNTHEFAWGVTTNNPHYGPTRNPWDHDRIPGGSSGGSGAAVVAHLAAAAMGSDTGGSIRIPAALCGCVGLKPTYGRVSKAGVIPMSSLYDHTGPLARTVEDAALLLQAVAGYDALDPNSARVPVADYTAQLRDGVAGLRLGVPRGYFDFVEDDVRVAFELAIEKLGQLGATIVDAPLDLSQDLTMGAFGAVFAESQHWHAPYFPSRETEYGADLQTILSSPPANVAAALEAGEDVRQRFQAALEDVDALLTPTCPSVAPLIGAETVTIAGHEVPVTALASLTMPTNIARLPVLSLPCGASEAGLPIGLSITGRAFDEALVLRIGHAYEQATEWHLREPR